MREFEADSIDFGDFPYALHNPERLLTPCLLVYPQRIRANLRKMVQMVGDPERLRPHVKTHKTAEIVRMALEEGISKHKCATLSEALMLAECQVPDVLLAYQPVGPAARKLVDLAVAFPRTKFTTLVEDLSTAQRLSQHAVAAEKTLDILLDIDCGMHRTGIPAGSAAAELYAAVDRLPGLRAAGLHVYDGQNHQPQRDARQAAVEALMQPVSKLVGELKDRGLAVPKLVCGGTPTFPVYAGLAVADLGFIECSPGTCVLSDFNYGRDYADMSAIQNAAVLMTRVISANHPGQLTVDLGNKAVAADPPAGRRCHFLNLPNAEERIHSEEHLVLGTSAASDFDVGDVLYALPAHICPTVALHSHLHAVEDGQITAQWKVTARDRLYEVAGSTLDANHETCR